MIDIEIPTTDGRDIRLTRYSEPSAAFRSLLAKLKLQLPEQPSPKFTVAATRITAAPY